MLEIVSVICRKGSVHDYKILEESRLAISPETEKLADKGYQGITKLYANSSTPIKEYRSKPLTREAKQFNRRLATRRIGIEHLWRTVKYENVYLHPYDSVHTAWCGLNNYFKFYNEERLHGSLNTKTPHEVYFQQY